MLSNINCKPIVCVTEQEPGVSVVCLRNYLLRSILMRHPTNLTLKILLTVSDISLIPHQALPSEELLDEKHQRVDIPAHSRAAYNGHLRLKDWKRISAESFLMSLRRSNQSGD